MMHMNTDAWVRCRGGPLVPHFLRYEGYVRTFKMSKRDVELRVKELWALKTLGDQKALQRGDPIISMPRFFL
jgi:hypothetical protein